VLKPLLASLKQQVQVLNGSRRRGGKPDARAQPVSGTQQSSSSGLGKYIELVLDAR
jgi:hypothetical protein